MSYPGNLTAHHELFFLDFVANPKALLARGESADITHSYTLEITAWCMELNEQLKALAADMGIALQLMGGNAASLRLDAAAQRGSRDNDYLTTTSEPEIQRLMDRLAERFAALPEPLLRPRRMSAAGKLPLPLVSFLITVPALIVENRETLEAKVEFHLEEVLPPGQDVTGQPFAVGQPLTTTIPALPFQIGLKLIVFDDPPVGIPPERDDVLPRQMHDIDLLARTMTDPGDWGQLGPYVKRRYTKERQYQGLDPEPDGPWTGIQRRMNDWAQCDRQPEKWKAIQNFQTGQIGRSTRRSAGEWRARANRLAVMAQTAATDRTDLYLRALQLEEHLDPNLSGRQARKPRAAIGAVMGEYWTANKAKLNGYGIHVTFWEALATGPDLEARLDELRDVLPR